MTDPRKPAPDPDEPPFWMISLGSFLVALTGTVIIATKIGGWVDVLLCIWWACGTCAVVLVPSRVNTTHGIWDYITALAFGPFTLWTLLKP